MEAERIANNQEMEYIEVGDFLRVCQILKFIQVDEPMQVKVVKKVLIPNMKNVRFNFVGKVT